MNLKLSVALALVVSALAVLSGSSATYAATTTPWWSVTSAAEPSSLPVEGSGLIVVTAQNLGDAPALGESSPVRIADKLPAGLKAIAIKGVAGKNVIAGNRGPVTCSLKTLTCTFENALPAYEQIEVQITVIASEAHSGEINEASVSGGGATSAVNATHAITVGEANRFGFEEFSLRPEEPGGVVDTQAGSHPFQLTSVVTFKTQSPDATKRPRTVALPKDVSAELPAGLIGNPTPFTQCTETEFSTIPQAEAPEVINECPADSAVGVATVSVNEPKVSGYITVTAPIFNMVPLPGEPARFGFKAAGIFPVFLDAAVRTGGDYGVTITASDITQVGWAISTKLTFWGVPGDPRHDGQRGWECLLGFGSCPTTHEASPPPFLALPTSCAEPLAATIAGDSWGSFERPAEAAEPLEYVLPQKLDGCNHLPFSPSIRVTPDGSAASSPSGLDVDVHVPQQAVLHPESLAESAVKQITVALPQGMAVSPSGADGLEACSESAVGYLPAQSNAENLLFTPDIGGMFCPDASKVGTVDISSPLLPAGQHVTGAVYLATQTANPFGSLIAMYIVAEDPISGTVVKQAGEVHLTSAGQLITTVKDVPQLAFEDAELHFFGGERAPLATPARCGAYTTSAQFTPWSGNEPVSATSTFNITSGPHGSACPGQSLPFTPSLVAGSTSVKAGAFSPFSTTISREDGNQGLSEIQLRMPPGLSGVLTGIPLCGEEQANDGACAAASLIGETTIGAGVGTDPVSVKGGRIYLTGPYQGAPFGLSIVNPVKAGPFDLENTATNHPACDCIVVRARIEVDPLTAQLTATTDKEGSHAIPQLIEGIPVQIKHVNALINRPNFTFDPTNCDAFTVAATVTGDEGATSQQSTPFQAANCATLKFAPKFSATASAPVKTSRFLGASLHVKLSYPKAAFGSQANLLSTKVELPKQLPSRLGTLQKACLAATFNANPANCPPHSVVGHAKVITPILPVPLEGSAYFVSHGGEAFPSLTIVLKGYGVTVQLVGTTFISKKSITSSTFKATPDVPFNTFELTLPQGQYSALGSPSDLCKAKKLVMPTTFKAQNGAQLKQNTPIVATGCPKHHAKSRTKTAARRKKHS